MKKQVHEVVCDNARSLVVTKWVDNQCIHIAGFFYVQDSVLKQKDMTKKRVFVTCPNVIKVYNAHMGGVDIAAVLTTLLLIKLSYFLFLYLDFKLSITLYVICILVMRCHM